MEGRPGDENARSKGMPAGNSVFEELATES